jgi:hypothetical protein
VLTRLLYGFNCLSPDDVMKTADYKTGHYRARPVTKYRLGVAGDVAFVSQDGRVYLGSVEDGDLLSHCTEFRSLAGHEEVILAALEKTGNTTVKEALSHMVGPLGPKCFELLRNTVLLRQRSSVRGDCGRVRERLAKLVQQGLLINLRDTFEVDTPTNGRNPEGQIKTVAILTRDRPISFARSLESYSNNLREHGRRVRLLVLDDSHEVARRRAACGWLKGVGAKYGIPSYYGGFEEKLLFAEALAEEVGVSSELLKFAIIAEEWKGRVLGSNRNAFLLETIGEMALAVDDDTLCKPAAIGARAGVQVSSDHGFMEYYFFGTLADALERVAFLDVDILAVHEKLLGKSVSRIAGNRFEVGRVNDDLMLRWPRGRIVVSACGLVGDSGLYSPSGYLGLGGDSRCRLMFSRETYEGALASRQLIRTASCYTITNSPWCVGTVAGYDNRDCLPPFFSVERNTDGIFGLTVQRCVDGGFFGHAPYLLIHAPLVDREYSPESLWRSASSIRISDVIIGSICACSFPTRECSSQSRLRLLGAFLTELGNLRLGSFEEFLRLQVVGLHSGRIGMLEERLQEFGGHPEFWRKDVERYLDTSRRRIQEDDYFVPVDLGSQSTREESLEILQRLVLKFGQVLNAWPDLIEGSLRVRDRLGVGIARKVT